MKIQFEKIIEVTPAFDKRNSDPKKDYGVHGCNFRMILKGSEGAIQFVIYTNWHLPHVEKTRKHTHWKFDDGHMCPFKPLPADFGYHSKKPLYEGQPLISDKCEYVNGSPCYYDGSGLRAEKVFKTLTEKGLDGVWEEMEQEYKERF